MKKIVVIVIFLSVTPFSHTQIINQQFDTQKKFASKQSIVQIFLAQNRDDVTTGYKRNKSQDHYFIDSLIAASLNNDKVKYLFDYNLNVTMKEMTSFININNN